MLMLISKYTPKVDQVADGTKYLTAINISNAIFYNRCNKLFLNGEK